MMKTNWNEIEMIISGLSEDLSKTSSFDFHFFSIKENSVE